MSTYNTVGEVTNAVSKIYDGVTACAKTANQVSDQTTKTTDEKLHYVSWCSMELTTEDGRAWGLDPWDRI